MARKGKTHPGAPIALTRKIVKHGKSYYLAIPPEFMEKHQLKKGDVVPMVANSILKIVPVKEVD